MGNELSQGNPSDLESMKRYHGMSPGQVLLIKEKFELMADEDLTIDKNSFQQLMKLKPAEADKIFSFFDLANDGRIDSHEFICALALISQAPLKEKAEIIFSLYDFDHNRTITKNELVILIKTSLTALGAMSSKGECTIQEAEQKAEEILRKYDTNKDSTISLKEFQSFISKDPDILRLLFSYGIISTEDMRLDFGGGDIGEMPEPDSDLEKEVTRKNLAFDQKVERKKVGIEHLQGVREDYQEEEEQKQMTYGSFQNARRGNNPRQWLNQVKNAVPTYWKPGKGEANPPAASLELDYVYGFRCFDSRNNIKYTDKGELVYPMAAVGIVLEPSSSSISKQRFFLEHTDDITCIDVSKNCIATGQVGNDPIICIWEPGTSSKAVLRGLLKWGVAHLAFSNEGQKLVAVGMDPDHCIVVYDVTKAMAGRGSGKREDYLISSGKGPRSDVFDVKFDKVDKNIILACKNEVYFGSYDSQNIKLIKGLWDAKTCPYSTVTTIGVVDNNVITGTFKGQLVTWRGNRATSSIEAHRGPVLAMVSRKYEKEPGLITGGRDGIVLVFTPDMKQRYKIVIGELNLKILNPKICAIGEHPNGTSLAIGTRGSDIIDVQIQGQKARLVMRGHSEGMLRGLTVHPKLQQFYTIGEDNILACWNIKERKMMSCIKLDYPSRAIHISQDYRFLAVGSLNGTILIIDPKTLIPTFNFKDRDAEVSCIKFSHDTEMLAVGHTPPACEIIIYSIKNHFKKTNVLRGSPATIISIDFSMNCKILQVNDYSCQVLYYELGGEGSQKVVPNGAVNFKDERWSTYSAIYGWHVQGVWPEVTSGNDINAVDRSFKGDIIVTADDYSSIKLFRFPAPIIEQGYNRYSGHSAHVSNVRFTADDDYVISLGGADKSIFQWKFYYDKDLQLELDIAADSIPDAPVYLEYQKISPVEQVEEESKVEGQVKQYLGPVKATVPSNFKPDLRKDNQLPNGHLVLNHIFGFKTQNHEGEALNMVKYLYNGKVVYTAGSVGVVHDPKPRSLELKENAQTFFNYHKEDINCMTIHPDGLIVATGGRAFGLLNTMVTINVWDSESKQVISSIRDFHLRYVSALAFTQNKAFLISAGGDQDNSIAVHDWQTNQLLCTLKTGKATINEIVILNQNEFVFCGQKNIKFFEMNGRNLKSKPIAFGGQYEPMTCMVAAFPSESGYECITGSVNGNIVHWKENCRPFKAHDGKITSLVFDNKGLLYSAGLDGIVQTFHLKEGQLTRDRVLMDVSKTIVQPLAEFKNYYGIISMDVQKDNILIATKSAGIYEIQMSTINNMQIKYTEIMQGHFDGELWGMATSPNQQRFVTCGGDQHLIVWDIETKKRLMISKPFDQQIRAVDWSPSGAHIVVGDLRGFIYLVDASNLQVLEKRGSKFSSQTRISTAWIQDIKFSPDGTKIAFGAHTTNSHVEVWEIDGSKFGKPTLHNISLTGALMHLDWANDNVHLVVNTSNYELKFINQIKTKEATGPAVRDLDWASWTCVLGFPVQGIYRSKEELEITSVCTNKKKQVIVSGEYNGTISLFKYPAVCPPPQQNREYKGHSSAVTRVRLTHDDQYLVSLGALDRCIFLWGTDLGQDEQKSFDPYDDVTDLNLMQEKTRRFGPEKYGKVRKQEQSRFDDEDEPLKTEEYVSIKPWMGAIKEPSNYYKDPLNQNKAPMVDISLEYVHGYRSRDCKNNVRYLKNGSILFNTAALGVVMDPLLNTQKFYQKHDDDVVCLDVAPDGKRAATGSIGSRASVQVWDTNTQQTICHFKNVFSKGVIAVGFSPSGDKLLAVGLDDAHMIAVFDVLSRSRTGGVLLYMDKIGPDVITDVKWQNDSQFCTFGINHLKYWSITAGGLNCKKATLNKNQSTKYLVGGFLNDDCLAAGSDGYLQVYKGMAPQTSVYCHENKPFEALQVTKEFIITGGRDFKINFIDVKGSYKILFSTKVTDSVKGALLPEVKSVQLSFDSKSVLIGTAGSEIYELTTKDAKIISGKFQQYKSILKGHFAPNRKTINEVWGLAVNPNDVDQYYTCGDDGTLRCWSIGQRRLMNLTRTIYDQNGVEVKPDENGELTDQVRGRSIGVSPDGVYVVVGFKDGTLRVYDKELKQKFVIKCAKEWISDIKFSHDSQSLAIGSHDSTINVYSFPELKLKNKPLRKHASYITHIDFSMDGNFLHSNCGGHELLFWDVNNGKNLPNGANAHRDERWLTWTATLGWAVQGMWPEIADANEINTVDRSHQSISGSDKPPDNYYLMACGDDLSQVKVYRYPCIKKGSEYINLRGHSSHITGVRFSGDDNYLFTAGGDDLTVMQWKIVRKR